MLNQAGAPAKVTPNFLPSEFYMQFRVFLRVLAGGSIFLYAIFAISQSLPSPLVTQPIDESKIVTLQGSVHPLGQWRYDRGAVPDSLPAKRMLLLLNRPADRENALQEFLRDVHTRGSSLYHQWVTPRQFGERFGPSDADIQTAVTWLQSHGFTVARVTKSDVLIEFSGTAGQLREAFHTEIHEYNIKGEVHYANANEASIPAALAPLVRGVSPLNNFRAQSYLELAGTALYSRATKRATPQWTIPNPFGTSNPYAYPVAPEDFATQYDLSPLYQAGVNGSGQVIGIINESNIDLSLVSAYQQLFDLPNNPPQVVIDGDDPGTNNASTEAYLDVEVSGAVAPNATVDLYISNGSDFQDPISLAALRAIEDNQASVLSVSFGECEMSLGTSGNQFWSSLWEQAAAQGQTVLVAAGDFGPDCDLATEPSVSGLASTPWNVAVGGTDFYYSDYATGGASAATLWNQTNDSNLGSLIAPLPEQVWNDPFGQDIISNGLARSEIFSGGGGPSSCSTISTSAGQCTSGYAKPAWQIGPGVPADGVRDLPDVSLFASNGANLSAYPICASAGECTPGTDNASEILLVGGTSGSSPAMAGIMALVNQKYGRQGQADFVLYPLAQQQPATFRDITLGSNDTVCETDSPDCVVNANGDNVTTIYSAGPGYDVASGIGSVDANALVSNWNSITSLPTRTNLSLSSTNITHGTAITVTASVAASSGTGTPSGGVAIVTSSPAPQSQGQTVLTLSGGSASSSVNFFPGGYYNVSADYHGDAVFGASTSTPVALNVTPENSNINFSVLNGQTEKSITSGSTVPYENPLSLVIQPIGVNAPSGQTDGNATGTATFTVDSTTGTVALNSAGVASWTAPALAPGTHVASATYSGDLSFNASSATPVTFSVTKGLVEINDSIDAPFSSAGPWLYVNPGGSLTTTVTVAPLFSTLATGMSAPLGTATPTGTITFCLGGEEVCSNPSYSQTVTLSSPSGTNSLYASAAGTFTNLAAGEYFPTYQYSGDANYQAQGSLNLENIIVGSTAPLTASTTVLTIAPGSVSGSGLAAFTTTVTGSSGIAPTGQVNYYNNGIFLTYDLLSPASTGATSSVSFYLSSAWFWNNGNNQIMAIYQGDSNYQPSSSNVVNLEVTQSGGDFTLAPQTPQITVQSGASGTLGLNLMSLSGFNSVVTLACAPSSTNINCSLNPASPTVNGAATSMLTITAATQPAETRLPRRTFIGWLDAGGALLCAVVLFGKLPDKKRTRSRLLGLILFAALPLAVSCGSGSSSTQATPPPPPASSTIYSVVVTGTANGIVHNAKVLVSVQ
jgi:subtilase family serine protease